MKDVLPVIGFLVLWIALNRWILPWFGVQTCMSGACRRVAHTEQIKVRDIADKSSHESSFKSN